MENSFDQTAMTTIDLLETRLRRIEYVLYGQERPVTAIAAVEAEGEPQESAVTRLEKLEGALHGLTLKSKVIRDLLQLHSRHPELFQASVTPLKAPSLLTPSMQESMVLSSASTFNFTSSGLTSVMDVPVPPAEASLQLISIQPRLAKIQVLQECHEKELSRLREETVRVLQRWYQVHVMGVGDFWADVAGRLEGAERRVRRTT